MKKIMILKHLRMNGGVVMVVCVIFSVMACFISCDNTAAVPYVPSPDWSLDIVKFKNPEYKNHILARRYPANRIYDSYVSNDVPIYCVERPLWYRFEKNINKDVWVDLSNGYFLCTYLWQTIFLGRYKSYNICEFKDIIDNLVLMDDEWTAMSDTVPYILQIDTSIPTYGPQIWSIDTTCIYGLPYYTDDESHIIDSEPMAEHYVVTANSLYSFMHSSCDAVSKEFLSWEPGLQIEDGTLSREIWKNIYHYSPDFKLRIPLENSEDINFYKDRYDSLFVIISSLLKTVVESDKLPEYLEYDRKYNRVEEEKADEDNQANCTMFRYDWERKYK